VPIVTPGYEVVFPPKYWQKSAEAKIKNYDQYINGNYMPPI